jgi:hypothetical protein
VSALLHLRGLSQRRHQLLHRRVEETEHLSRVVQQLEAQRRVVLQHIQCAHVEGCVLVALALALAAGKEGRIQRLLQLECPASE